MNYGPRENALTSLKLKNIPFVQTALAQQQAINMEDSSKP